MFDFLARLLNFFYVISGESYIGAIVLFTIAVMLALFPITAKQAKSMVEMQRIQPEIKKLQQKYKNDRQALNQAMMELYKEHGVNPLAGCLPLIIQLPVFLVLYRVLAGLTNTGDDGTLDPSYLPHDSALYEALDDERGMFELGFDLARSAADAVSDGLIDALPFLFLVALTVVTGIYQQKQMTRRTPQQNVTDNPQAAAMQRMGKIMPIMFGIFSWGFPAGLVLYFVVSNLFRIAQQAALYRFDPTLRAHAESKNQAARGTKGVIKASATEKQADKPDIVRGNGAASAADAPGKGKPTPARRQGKKKRKGR